MKGSNVAGINPKMRLPKGPKPTTVAGLSTKGVGAMKAKVSPHQNLALKSYKAAKSTMGTVQGMKNSIHKNRGGSAMKAIFRGKA